MFTTLECVNCITSGIYNAFIAVYVRRCERFTLNRGW